MSLVVLILSLVLAVLFFQQFGHWLARSSHTPHWLLENVFLAMVVVLLFVGWILTALLFTLLPGPRGGYSTVFGGVLGLIRGLALVFLVLLVLNHFHMQDHSYLQKTVQEVAPKMSVPIWSKAT